MMLARRTYVVDMSDGRRRGPLESQRNCGSPSARPAALWESRFLFTSSRWMVP